MCRWTGISHSIPTKIIYFGFSVSYQAEARGLEGAEHVSSTPRPSRFQFVTTLIGSLRLSGPTVTVHFKTGSTFPPLAILAIISPIIFAPELVGTYQDSEGGERRH
jgi:hypothetical protein